MKNLRTMEILEYLKEKKHCSVMELMNHFHVSSATIHRDLTDLAARNAIRKVHGGVAYPETPIVPAIWKGPAQTYLERINWNKQRKMKVAQQAVTKVCEGDILFLDSSTTVACLAELLAHTSFSNLTIVTNSVTIIQNFNHFPSHYVLVSLGGSYDVQLNAFIGQAAIRELEQLSISKAFVSAFGVRDDNVTTNHEHHAGILRRVLDMAPQKYLLLDKSKLNRAGLFKIANVRIFDEMLTD